VVAVAHAHRQVAGVRAVRATEAAVTTQANGAVTTTHLDVGAAADDERPNILQLIVAVAQVDVDVAADAGRGGGPEAGVDVIARRPLRAGDIEVAANGSPEQVAHGPDQLLAAHGRDAHVLAHRGRRR